MIEQQLSLNGFAATIIDGDKITIEQEEEVKAKAKRERHPWSGEPLPKPKEKAKPRYRLTMQRDDIEEDQWPKAIAGTRDELLQLCGMFETCDYEFHSLERLLETPRV